MYTYIYIHRRVNICKYIGLTHLLRLLGMAPEVKAKMRIEMEGRGRP